MSDGLLVGEGASPTVQGAGLAADAAELLALRTGLPVGERPGLLLQEGAQRAFQQALGGRLSHLLKGEQVPVEAGAGVAEGAAGDDFAPLGGELA